MHNTYHVEKLVRARVFVCSRHNTHHVKHIHLFFFDLCVVHRVPPKCVCVYAISNELRMILCMHVVCMFRFVCACVCDFLWFVCVYLCLSLPRTYVSEWLYMYTREYMKICISSIIFFKYVSTSCSNMYEYLDQTCMDILLKYVNVLLKYV